MRTLTLVTACLLVAVSARAQSNQDVRWAPFLGCWDLVVQDAPRPGPARGQTPDADAEARPGATERPSARVCVDAKDGGVTMTTTVGDQPALVQTVVADASARPIADATCRGTERAEWSRDGLRLFSSATLTCPGEPERSVSGIALQTADGRWIDVQAVTVQARESVRVRHYRRSGGDARDPSSRVRAQATASRMTVDDVAEASRKVSAGALEAALIESRARFSLSGATLVALDDAGVPDSVTDLMVALSYPRAFVVERTSRDDRLVSLDPYGYAGPWSMFDPFGFGSYFPGDAYGAYFNSGYYYSPFGYSYLRSYPFIFGGAGSVIGVGGGAAGQPAPQEQGRVINGLGYTRVMTTRDAETLAAGSAGGSSSGGSGRGAVTTRGYVDGGSASSGSTSSGGSSSSGSSGGSATSGGDTGRTAVPR